MAQTTIVILGGYGTTGWLIADLLLRYSDVRVVIAGRNAQKASQAADRLSAAFPSRVTAAQADAADAESLKAVLRGAAMLVVASSTADYTRQIAEAALAANCDYLDIQISETKLAVLREMKPRIRAAGRCFITDGGFHPGLPAALVRYVAPQFDQLQSANVGSVIKVDFSQLALSESTACEMVDMCRRFVMECYRDGCWRQASWRSTNGYQRMDFGQPFGWQWCVPMGLAEMRALPEQVPALQETGFFVGGFNAFTDYVVMPLTMLGMRIWPSRLRRPLARLMLWSVRRFSKPPFGTRLKVEARGIREGRIKTVDLMLSHPDGYVFTAVPVVATVMQWLDGTIRRPGLWLQGNLVEPERLMKDMQRMGIEVRP